MALKKYLVIYRPYSGIINGTEILMAYDEDDARRLVKHNCHDCKYIIEVREIGF
jgi:hypothetical protein